MRRSRPFRGTSLLAAVATGAVLVSSLVPAVAPRAWAADAGAQAQPTWCDPHAAGLVPVLQIDLPEAAAWGDRDVPYDVDATDQVAGGFDRIGYCLEVDGPSGPQHVWTAMEPFTTDASRLGLQTKQGQAVRQRVDDLEVVSDVPGVVSGPGQSGWLEMWPNTYAAGTSGQVANASAQSFDSDDSISAGMGYGSFQVHRVGATRDAALAPQPVLAVNTFTGAGGDPLSIGIGRSSSGHSDWTHAFNAGDLTTKRLTVYARPAVVSLTAAPQDRQLYPRDARNGATVQVAGTVTDRGVRQVSLTVRRDGRTVFSRSQPAGAFDFRPRIEAGLHQYTFELVATGPRGLHRTAGVWGGVVAGDVYAVQGQSNAVAARYTGSASGEESPFLRSYGTPNPSAHLSAADRVWHEGIGDLTNQSGSIGMWPARMGRTLIDTYGVPVAILNGGRGGQAIGYFQRSDGAPDDLSTNYGRFRQRLTGAGVLDDVRGLLWYQGEADGDNAGVHVAGFTTLLEDWRSELGGAVGGTEYFVFQVRTAPCNNSTTIATRDAQRRLGDTHDVTVVSTTALSGHDGCHFAWVDGYREMGDHAFDLVARDLHGGPSAGVAPPNPDTAAFTTQDLTEITVRLRSDDPLTVDAGAGADFRVDGADVTVTDVTYAGQGRLVLTLSGPATGATGVSYVAHLRAGPEITNESGAGLLAFGPLPLG